MNIVYFAATEFPNEKSHSIQILNTCHALARQGVRVELFARKIHGTPEEALSHYDLEPHPNLVFRRMSETNKKLNRWSGRTFRFYLYFLVLKDLFRKGKTFYCFRGTTKAFELIQHIRPLCRLLKIPIIYELHVIQYLDLIEHHGGRYGEGEDLENYREQRRLLEDKVYNDLDGIIAISDRLRRLAIKHFGVERPVLIAPSGVRLKDVIAPSRDDREIDLCYVGGLYQFNGVDVLVEAMKHLPEKKLTVAGGGDEGDIDRLKELARKHGVDDRISFLGHVPHPEALLLMRRAKVVVAPLMRSTKDDRVSWCSPGKIFEYMASGATIVSSRLDVLEEIVEHEQNSILVEPNNPDALAAGINRAFEDEPLSRRLATQAFEDVKEYRFDNRAQKMIQFFEKICE